MTWVKNKDEKDELAADAAVLKALERVNENGGLLHWSPDQHFKYWEDFWDKQLASERLASEQCPVLLPCTDNGDVIIID